MYFLVVCLEEFDSGFLWSERVENNVISQPCNNAGLRFSTGKAYLILCAYLNRRNFRVVKVRGFLIDRLKFIRFTRSRATPPSIIARKLQQMQLSRAALHD